MDATTGHHSPGRRQICLYIWVNGKGWATARIVNCLPNLISPLCPAGKTSLPLKCTDGATAATRVSGFLAHQRNREGYISLRPAQSAPVRLFCKSASMNHIPGRYPDMELFQGFQETSTDLSGYSIEMRLQDAEGRTFLTQQIPLALDEKNRYSSNRIFPAPGSGRRKRPTCTACC